MIARELLVKLGFDIDEGVFSRWIRMSDTVKKKAEEIKPIVYNQAALKEVERIKGQIAGVRNLRSGTGTATERMLAQFDQGILEELQSRETTIVKQVVAKNPTRFSNFFKRFDNLKMQSQELLRKLNPFGQVGRFGSNSGRQQNINLGQLNSVVNKIALIATAITGTLALRARSTFKNVEEFKRTGVTSTGNTFSKDQVKTVDNFNRSFRSLKYSINEISDSFIISLLPRLNEVIIKFKNWLDVNKETINQGLDNVIGGISKAFEILWPKMVRVFNVLNAIVTKTIGWQNLIAAIIGVAFVSWITGVVVRLLNFLSVIKGVLGIGTRFLGWVLSTVGGLRGLVATLLRLTRIPFFGWIAAAVAGLILLGDEILVTLKGGDSFINDFLKADVWGWFNKKLEAIIDSFKSMWSWITKTSDVLGDMISNQLDKISNILPDLSGIGKMVGNRKIEVPAGAKLINMKDRLTKYDPQEAFGNSNSVMNTTNRNNKVLNQRNSFNINVNTSGTSQEQTRTIVDLVQKELQKTFDYENEKALIAVGVHS